MEQPLHVGKARLRDLEVQMLSFNACFATERKKLRLV
jgi:hypothetical protein